MYITPMNSGSRILPYAIATNNINFKGAEAISMPDVFIKEPRTLEKKSPSYKEKFEMLKPYSKDRFSLLKLAMLNDEEFNFVHSAVKEVKQNVGFLPSDGFSYKKDSLFENIKERSINFPSTNGGGHFSYKKSTSDKGENKVFVSRKKEIRKDFLMEEYIDTSCFNPNYQISNAYLSQDFYDNNHANKAKREIVIKRASGETIFAYSYSRLMTGKNRELSSTVMNNKKYMSKTLPDGRVAIKCGDKGGVFHFLSRLDLSDMQSGDREIQAGKINSKKDIFVSALKLLPPQILSEMDDDFDKFKNNGSGYHGRTLNVNLICPEACVDSMINGTVENVSRKKGLIEDKTLIDIFSKERENYVKWLVTPKENVLKMGEDYYISHIGTKEEDLMNIIKSVCRLLWCENYEENKTGDEDMRLLLNFFPESVSYIASVFEVNGTGKKIAKYE